MPALLPAPPGSASRRRRPAARPRSIRRRWPSARRARAANPAADRTRASRRRRPRRRARRRPRSGRAGPTCGPSRVATSTPAGPCLTIATSTPSSSSRSAASSGSRVPTATSTSSRLPTATVAKRSASRAIAVASAGSAQNIGRWSRSWITVPPLAGPQRRQRRRAAGLLAEAGAGHPQDPGVADRVEVQLLDRDLQVRRLRLAVEEQREVVGRVDLAERQRRAQRGVDADEAVVDAELAQRARGSRRRTGRRRPS